MLESVLMHLKNWFAIDVKAGTYTIKGNDLVLPFLHDGQYYRICGSVFNDGLHKYGDMELLEDETFTGTIWALAIPKAVMDLTKRIEEWQAKNGDAVSSPYSSESFGGYSYTKATDSVTGAPATWETVFRSQLNPYRKLRENTPVKPRRGLHEPY